MPWFWDNRTKRYRDENGRFLSRDRALAYVQQSLNANGDAAAELGRLWWDSSISLGDFNDSFRQEIKIAVIQNYLQGIGGRGQMTPADWGRTGGIIAEQYRFLDGLLAAMENGEISSLAQLQARLRMYINSAREAYERANEIAHGMRPRSLPAYPGDGTSICLTNCECSWRMEIVRDGDGNIIRWDCYWELGSSKPCDTCLRRSREWSPYMVNN